MDLKFRPGQLEIVEKALGETARGLQLDIAAGLPGEKIIISLTSLAEKHRDTMSQANRDEFDRVFIAMLRGWHNFWISIGWPGEKV